MSLRGNVKKLRGLAKSLRDLPVRLAQDVAERTAPDLTQRARASFLAGQTPYGDPWPLGADGQEVTLIKTRRTFNALQFVSVGTIVRVVMSKVPYLKYHIGRYQILPPGGKAMPLDWSKSIAETVNDEIPRHLGRAS